MGAIPNNEKSTSAEKRQAEVREVFNKKGKIDETITRKKSDETGVDGIQFLKLFIKEIDSAIT